MSQHATPPHVSPVGGANQPIDPLVLMDQLLQFKQALQQQQAQQQLWQQQLNQQYQPIPPLMQPQPASPTRRKYSSTSNRYTT